MEPPPSGIGLVALEFARAHLPKSFCVRRPKQANQQWPSSTPRLQLSDDLHAATWSPNAQESSILDRYRKQSVEFALDFWKQVILARAVPGFSSDELLDVHDSNGAFTTLCKRLNDRERIRNIALEIGFSHAAKIDQRWLWFRFLQAWALHGLVLLRRYPNPRSGIPSEERMEHDVQDIEYLILALHAGALATRDESPKLKKACWRGDSNCLNRRASSGCFPSSKSKTQGAHDPGHDLNTQEATQICMSSAT